MAKFKFRKLKLWTAAILKFAVASDVARCLKVGLVHGVQEKPTYRRPFTSAVRASLAGSPAPSPEKIEFGIGGDAISRCLEGLNCLL